MTSYWHLLAIILWLQVDQLQATSVTYSQNGNITQITVDDPLPNNGPYSCNETIAYCEIIVTGHCHEVCHNRSVNYHCPTSPGCISCKIDCSAGNDICRNSTIYSHECDNVLVLVNSSTARSLQDATIFGPANGSLNVFINAKSQAIEGAKIHSNNSKDILISVGSFDENNVEIGDDMFIYGSNAFGVVELKCYKACHRSTIYCPITKKASCIIDCSEVTGAGQHYCYDMNVYTNNGIPRDLQFICKTNGSDYEVACANSMVYCGSGYTNSCEMQYSSGWNCITQAGSGCVFPTESPTNLPTHLPTKQPSIIPSPAPTKIPSGSPSDSPFAAPSEIPTKYPSVSPIVSPSVSPSMTPSMTPSITPSITPSTTPTEIPSNSPTLGPTIMPSKFPSGEPTTSPKIAPTTGPATTSTTTPSRQPILNYNNTNVSTTNFNGSTANDTKISDSTPAVMISMWEKTSYLVIIIFVTAFIIICVLGYYYHVKYTSHQSDMFVISSLFRVFSTLIDIFTDVVFCIILYILKIEPLYYYSVIFVAFSYLLSIICGVFFIEILRMRTNTNHYNNYFKRYNWLVVTCLIIIGFYPTFMLIGSKLFYFEFFNLHLNDKDKIKLLNCHFMVSVIFENIPQLMIQFNYYFIYHNENVTPILFISMLFSILSLLHSLLSQILRLCRSCHKRRNKYLRRDVVTFRLIIESTGLKKYHRMAYRKIESCLKTALDHSCINSQQGSQLDIHYSIKIISIASHIKLLNKISVVGHVIIDSQLLSDNNDKNNTIHKLINTIKQIGSDGTKNNTAMKNVLTKDLGLSQNDDIRLTTKINMHQIISNVDNAWNQVIQVKLSPRWHI